MYDLECDPDEMVDRWADPQLAETRARLLLAMSTELSFPSAAWTEREARF
jgi:hypothetical protein